MAKNENKEERNEELIEAMLVAIGENITREGLKDTPKRVVKMWKEIFRGYDETQKPKVTTFKNGHDNIKINEMITDEGDFYSHCEHHMVPFFGKYYFGYVAHPNGKVLGLSKVARIVDYFSAKLQIQERLVSDIVEYLWNELTIPETKVVLEDGRTIILDKIEPLGMALVMEGEHLCKTMRGAKKKGKMRTTELRGVMKENPATRAEFMGWVR